MLDYEPPCSSSGRRTWKWDIPPSPRSWGLQKATKYVGEDDLGRSFGAEGTVFAQGKIATAMADSIYYILERSSTVQLGMKREQVIN